MLRWLLASLAFLLGMGQARAATIGEITLHPPAPWKPTRNATQARGGTSLAWDAPNGSGLHVDFWTGLPPTDGGVMVVARKYPRTVAGQKVELIKTSQFIGHNAEVWIVFLRRGAAWYRIFARRTSRVDFEAVLQTVRFAPSQLKNHANRNPS